MSETLLIVFTSATTSALVATGGMWLSMIPPVSRWQERRLGRRYRRMNPPMPPEMRAEIEANIQRGFEQGLRSGSTG